MQWKRFSYIIFIIRTSSQTFCRLTDQFPTETHEQKRASQMEKNWTRTNSSFIQTNNFSRNHFTAKNKNKKGREREKKREKQTKPNRANKSAQNKNIPLGLSIRGGGNDGKTREQRETTEAVPAFGWRICNTNPAGSLSDLTQNCWLHMDHGRSTQNCPVLWFSDFWAHNVKIHS